jgi:hypothetical protein
MKTKKKKKGMMELLRDIRDKVSLETQDMSFEEMKEYLRKRVAEYEKQTQPSIAAEPRVKYGKH